MNSKILAATAAITAGVIISSAFMINNNKSDDIYSQIVTQDSTMKDFKASDIVVGMIPEAGNYMNPACNSIFLVPPTTDYKTAYLNAVSCFENVNPSHGRVLGKYHCVYADGRIDFKNVVSSTRVKDMTNIVEDARKKDIRKVSVYEVGSKGSSGSEGKSEYVYLDINKKLFNEKSSVDSAYENSITTFGIKDLYLFVVYELDGNSSLHANKKEFSRSDKNCKIDIDIKVCPNGERKLEGLEKIYDIRNINFDIFNPKVDVYTRYKRVPKGGNGR